MKKRKIDTVRFFYPIVGLTLLFAETLNYLFLQSIIISGIVIFLLLFFLPYHVHLNTQRDKREKNGKV